MSGKKCKHCGSSDIEVDPARGDAVCTNCGTVLEDNIIVAEVEFVANTHGGASAMGQFVSADTKGGATGFGGAFNAGIGQESREVTLKRARNGITALCQQLRLNQQCIDIACNFFKMALSRHLTNGRPASHIQAACVYITCRTEGTAHLLIDISDVLQICCYQLGRTYFRLSRALCINIPSVDPCLYVLRFASQLQFGDKKHEVSMTALRLVQRMKRDSIHSGRRPSGLCGAALLIAARLHDFCRTPSDVVRIVKVHETTLRKRLLEFGDTPSSALTLDEFMTVDLEEEQDPPAFRAARKRDKERLHKLIEEEDGEKELTELQREIDKQLERDNSKRKKIAALTPQLIDTVVGGGDQPETAEDCEASRFAAEDTLSLIDEITQDISKKEGVNMKQEKAEKGLGPDLIVMGLSQTEEKVQDRFVKPEPKCTFNKDLHREEELRLSEKDEEYVDSMIMSEAETRHKTVLWNKINAGYLKEQKIKEEMRAREREEGKDKKKKVRGSYRKKVPLNAATAGEAIEKMLQEKRMSTKINYDILKSLDQSGAPAPVVDDPLAAKGEERDVKINPKLESTSTSTSITLQTTEPIIETSPIPRKRSRNALPAPALVLGASPAPSPATPLAAPSTPAPQTPATPIRTEGADEEDEDLELEAEAEVPEVTNEMSIAAMLQGGNYEEDYDYEEY